MDEAMTRREARPVRGPGRPKGAASTCRQRLVDAALAAFSTLGYEGVSLRAIAAAAGCDVSMVAHYFGSKAELWLAVVDRLTERLAGDAGLAGAVGLEGGSVELRVRKAAGQLFDQVARDPHLLRFLVREQAGSGERFEQFVGRVFEPVFEDYRPLWQEAIDAGLFRVSHPLMVHTMLLGAMSFLAVSLPLFARLGEASMDLGQIRDAFVQGLLPTLPSLLAERGAQ
ncbi:MAG: TetR/AcrR family transcriptional regulator [Thauera phenolivorans]|uniref:TetR/AcrR family transcriptional regulator n=1 Tax=Thauera phenolivorans TaxID=1792543 RepID=A0A7X7LYK9_9RHOO|nr:TetR/AcrR family transcriptional regulator [Thauera phenolivorans]